MWTTAYPLLFLRRTHLFTSLMWTSRESSVLSSTVLPALATTTHGWLWHNQVKFENGIIKYIETFLCKLHILFFSTVNKVGVLETSHQKENDQGQQASMPEFTPPVGMTLPLYQSM